MKYNPPPSDNPSIAPDPNASYFDGDLSIGVKGSRVPAATLEFPQREIVNAIALAGLVPSNASLSQLAEAFKIVDVFNILRSATNIGSDQVWQAVIPALPQIPPPPGTAVWFKPGIDSTIGGTTFSVNGSDPAEVLIAGTPLQLNDVAKDRWTLLVWDGTNWQIVAGGTRIDSVASILQRDMDWYVDIKNGSDQLYDGTQPIVKTVGHVTHGPFKNISRAISEMRKYSMHGNHKQTIHVADGTYVNTNPANGSPTTGMIQLLPPNGTGDVYLTGNVASPDKVTIIGGFWATGGTWHVQGFRYIGHGVTSAFPGTTVYLEGRHQYSITSQIIIPPFNVPPVGYHIGAYGGGYLEFTADYRGVIEMNVAVSAHILANYRGWVNTAKAKPMITFLGSCSTLSFITANHLGSATVGFAYSGIGYVHGPQYGANTLGTIDNYSGGPFPGDQPGFLKYGGQYSG